MATDLGKVGMRMRGDWDSSTAYEVLDAVSYLGSLYIAKENVPENTTPTNTTYWQQALDAGYPKTAIEVSGAEGWTVASNNSYRIGNVCYIDIVLQTSNSITDRTPCCTVGSNAAPAATERFICPAAANVGSKLTLTATGFLTTGRAMSIGDNAPGAKEFAIRLCYVI